LDNLGAASDAAGPVDVAPRLDLSVAIDHLESALAALDALGLAVPAVHVSLGLELARSELES
jgi:hypothetical protein